MRADSPDDFYDADTVEDLLACCPHALLHADSLYLWDALADGRVLTDHSLWTAARDAFEALRQRSDISRTERGWSFGTT